MNKTATLAARQFRRGLGLALLVASLCTTHWATAQEAPLKFGKVSEAELKMTTYAPDSSAEAVVLADYGKTYFQYSQQTGFKLMFERHTRLKILRKEGLGEADIPIRYYESGGNREKVIDIKGVTYNLENGQVSKTKLEKSSIFDKEVTKNWHEVKIAMPNVKEGSVIEYSYTISSDFFFNLQTWRFQRQIPVAWSEYRVAIPEYFDYKMLSQGYHGFHLNEQSEKSENITEVYSNRDDQNGLVPNQTVSTASASYRVFQNRWVMKDVPAFKNEKFITTPRDYLDQIEFQLGSIKFPNSPLKPIMGTWGSLIGALVNAEDFGGFINKTGPTKDLVAQLTAGLGDGKEKLLAIYHHVRDNYTYNDDDDYTADHSVAEVLKAKSGSSAEINLLLINLLRQAGYAANPVILSTRGHGRASKIHPITNKFNYVLAQVLVGEETLLLDATDPLRPAGMLDYNTLSGEGLLIVESEQGGRWVPLNAQVKTATLIMGDLQLEANGTLKGELKYNISGYEALALRKQLAKKTAASQEAEGATDPAADSDVNDLDEANSLAKRKLTNIEHEKDLTKALKATEEIEIAEFGQVSGDRIYFSPLPTFKMTENPFKQGARAYPVDFAYPSEESFFLTITLPDGYVIEEQPKNVRMPWGDGKKTRFEYLMAVNGNRLQITIKQVLGETLFLPDDYTALKSFFGFIIAKHAEQVVLKKSPAKQP
ncbi:MAG: DUF3857 and transglutaminase domain-containing protein [Bernardetiaceae bacterium]|jgi:hypothetical protein|nr:DUF3857 and transglutaminase domain-containing protein [Bernardetiaceae bacterium]